MPEPMATFGSFGSLAKWFSRGNHTCVAHAYEILRTTACWTPKSSCVWSSRRSP